MRVDLFDFDLPDKNIALRPVSPRDSARLLVVNESFEDRIVRDLPDLFEKGDILVFNNTKVIPTQLEGIRVRKGETAKVSATLHTRLSPDRWLCFAKGAKKLKPGDRMRFGLGQVCKSLDCSVIEKHGDGSVELSFDLSGNAFDERLNEVGSMPLPPYISGKRGSDARDIDDYQTRYASENGAVAAPTAGLHFTSDLLQTLERKGVILKYVTLHVGPGTFLPMKSDNTEDHVMHSEWGIVPTDVADAINAARDRGNRLACVGTTSLRLIESAAGADGRISFWEGDTDIFITPGYSFKAVDMLMTNFHLPRSTLFMLVSAFCGLEVMKEAYDHAIASGYRFYSYGDSSLLYRCP